MLRLEVSLRGLHEPVTLSRDDDAKQDVFYEVMDDPIATAVKFMERNETAKIIYVIDTHSLENGFFVWTGNEPKNYEACSLDEVSMVNSRGNV